MARNAHAVSLVRSKQIWLEGMTPAVSMINGLNHIFLAYGALLQSFSHNRPKSALLAKMAILRGKILLQGLGVPTSFNLLTSFPGKK